MIAFLKVRDRGCWTARQRGRPRPFRVNIGTSACAAMTRTRHIIVYIATSADGFIARPDGREAFRFSLAAVRLAKPPAVVRHPMRRGLPPSRSKSRFQVDAGWWRG